MNGILLTVWLAACGGDAISTHVALKRGAYEMIFTQNSTINTAIVGAQAIGFPLLVSRIRNKKLARTITYVAIGLRVFAVVNNIHVIGKLP